MSDQSSSYNNENVSFTAEKLPHCVVKFDMNIAPIASKAAYEKAVKNVSKEVAISGFRKGKAPKDLVIKQYGSYVDKEFKDVLLRNATHEAITLSKVELLKDARIKISEYTADPETGAHLIFETETLPILPEMRLEDLEIEGQAPKDVAETDIEKRIHDVQMHHASWSSIEDRPLQEGDYVTIDLSLIDGTPQTLYQNNRFHFTKDAFPEWLYNLMQGMSIGESKEAMSEKDNRLPAEAEHEPRLSQVVIRDIQTPTLPERNDEFAKKTGASSFEDLTQKITIQLQKQAEEEANFLLRQRMQSALLQKYPFDLPASTMEKIHHNIDQQMRHHIHTDACHHEDNEKENLILKTIENVKLNYLLDRVRSKFEIPAVSEQEILNRMISYSMQHPQPIEDEGQKEQYFQMLYENIKRDADAVNTIDFIVGKAKKV